MFGRETGTFIFRRISLNMREEQNWRMQWGYFPNGREQAFTLVCESSQLNQVKSSEVLSGG